MKERKERAALPVLWMLILAAAILLTACSEHSDQQNVVFEDMEAAFAQADLLSSNVEQMELVGITPGGYFSADGSDFKCGVLIPASEIRLCLAEWSR